MKAYINWSGGKDSSLALYHTLNDKNYSVEKLLTNVSGEYQRISMHGVREELLEQQATAIGIPLQKLVLTDQPSMIEYEEHMMRTMNQLQQERFTHSVFGDIFLEDLKIYRESQLTKVGMTAVFPLWKRNTTELIHEFIDLGFKTIVVCVNEKYLDKSFCGRIINEDFIRDLPENVDVCGENVSSTHLFLMDRYLIIRLLLLKEKLFTENMQPQSSKVIIAFSRRLLKIMVFIFVIFCLSDA
jgi:uncharacterized protein (TIGR00290 family)